MRMSLPKNRWKRTMDEPWGPWGYCVTTRVTPNPPEAHTAERMGRGLNPTSGAILQMPVTPAFAPRWTPPELQLRASDRGFHDSRQLPQLALREGRRSPLSSTRSIPKTGAEDHFASDRVG